ncbi:MAG: nitrilase-related carbon-nitrogen hydrolase, partial [Promethearchaeota archaeon]
MAITIACIQPQVYSNRKECYSEIKSLISQVLNNSQECDIFCLPERWVPLTKDISRSIQQERGEDYKFIKSIAKDFGINIISGAIWEK